MLLFPFSLLFPYSPPLITSLFSHFLFCFASASFLTPLLKLSSLLLAFFLQQISCFPDLSSRISFISFLSSFYYFLLNAHPLIPISSYYFHAFLDLSLPFLFSLLSATNPLCTLSLLVLFLSSSNCFHALAIFRFLLSSCSFY